MAESKVPAAPPEGAAAQLNGTHDPSLQSWVESANGPETDFPIQNLPFAVFRAVGEGNGDWRGGVAIGDLIVCLKALAASTVFDPAHAGIDDPQRLQQARLAAEAGAGPSLNALMELGPQAWSALRALLSQVLRKGSSAQALLQAALVPQKDVQYRVPAEVGDYTDFYTSIHHATNIGRLFRPDSPLLPNYRWVPIGYHGRSSSLDVSGQQFHRPVGQTRAPDAERPEVGPCRRLDYELELAIWIGGGNALGEPIGMDRAEDHVFGLSLLNDWSARDIQAWEYQPLGPFLAKSFASTLSPWIVTLEALRPFRLPFARPEGEPQPLPYLDSAHNRDAGALDVRLEVLLQTAKMREKGRDGQRITQTSYRHAYWTLAQMVAHHTVNGCNLRSGDLFGSGTLSGPTLDQAGALIELTEGGRNPIALADGERRSWLEDGDTVVMRAFCERAGAARIGFGECRGTVLPARSPG